MNTTHLPELRAAAESIQRQYDEVIASYYDLDPQSLIADSQDKAIRQIQQHGPFAESRGPLRVLDLGVGTGMFLEKLQDVSPEGVLPYGLDLSEKMIEIARARLPELVAVVVDAANFDRHFEHVAFDMICTHFITGFVPMGVLAPRIWERLAEGGYWCFVGGTKAGFPGLQKMATSKLLKWVFKGRMFDINDFVCNPADESEVSRTLKEFGFEVCACETFEPQLYFKDFGDFYKFAYHGGWLTPIIEDLGLHKRRPFLTALLNTCLFPVHDHHSIVIALGRKRLSGRRNSGS